jgi:DNA replication protein DnaD
MFDTPFYIAEEYLYNNKIYKGKYPISIVEEPKHEIVTMSKEQILQELAETELSRLEPEESVNGSKYIISQIDTNDKKQSNYNNKQILPVI